MIEIDGAYGEGGGQIIRTTLALSAILSQPVRLKNIRAKRKNPGLAAQHLTAVWAAAMICDAELIGDELGSTEITFVPQSRPIPGIYEFDVAEAREGGSAGATSLVLQTILLPLALATEPSNIILKGGTHVPWSPPFHYIQDVYLPTLANLGLHASVELLAWGWYPAGQGGISLHITPWQINNPQKPLLQERNWVNRGSLNLVRGIAVASSLPAHIAQRMRDRAVKFLEEAGVPTAIEPQRVRSVSPGAGIFLVANYGQRPSRAGFSVIGKKGKPAEIVAEEAVEQMLAFHRCGAVVEQHLADQLILPLALLGQPLELSVERVTQHTQTNLWVVEQFLGPVARVDRHQQLIHFKQRDSPR